MSMSIGLVSNTYRYVIQKLYLMDILCKYSAFYNQHQHKWTHLFLDCGCLSAWKLPFMMAEIQYLNLIFTTEAFSNLHVNGIKVLTLTCNARESGNIWGVNSCTTVRFGSTPGYWMIRYGLRLNLVYDSVWQSWLDKGQVLNKVSSFHSVAVVFGPWFEALNTHWTSKTWWLACHVNIIWHFIS